MGGQMSDQAAYKSTHPDVLAAHERITAERATWDSKATTWATGIAGLPDDAKLTRWRHHLAGFDVPEGTDPPEGWRFANDAGRPLRRGRLIVPNRSTRTGKRLYAEMSELGVPPDIGSLPGLPSDGVWVPNGEGSYDIYYAAVVFTDAVYAHFAAPPEFVENDSPFNSGIDLTIWERVPLSVFFQNEESRRANPNP